MLERKWILTASTFACMGLLLALLYYCNSSPIVRARISPSGLTVHEPMNYFDSTSDATVWRWEFGQGSTSTRAKGRFYYDQPGSYLVRLTVNNRYQRTFEVVVKPTRSSRDSTIQLLGPTTGYEGEKLAFTAYGTPARRYAWQFGETGQVDSRDPTAIYSYSKAGTYQVRLTTDLTPKVLSQTVRITPLYSRFTRPIDTTAEDIKWRLQRIANGHQINQQYNYLLMHYLCNKPNTPVVANSQQPRDFYSYCMGLQFDPKWVIDSVSLEPHAAKSCITKLTITQHKPE